jgi:hypothetical protein
MFFIEVSPVRAARGLAQAVEISTVATIAAEPTRHTMPTDAAPGRRVVVGKDKSRATRRPKLERNPLPSTASQAVIVDITLRVMNASRGA